MRKVLAAALLVSGCVHYDPTPFVCERETQCSVQGVCEPTTHLCSFFDASCESGRRYGDDAGIRSGTCVVDSSPGDAGID